MGEAKVFFKKWKMGVLCKKVENGGGCFFVKKRWKMKVFSLKKWKMGVFSKKSGPFLNAGCIMYSIS